MRNENLRRINLSIDKDLKEGVKAYAERNHTTMKKVIGALIAEKLAEEKASGK
jgi:hypothetical protein